MPNSENVDFGIDGQHDGSDDAQMKRFFDIIDNQRPESWQYHPDEELSSFHGHQSTSAKPDPPADDEKGIIVARPYLRTGADQQAEAAGTEVVGNDDPRRCHFDDAIGEEYNGTY
jgi:hypothetical protein